MSYVDADPARAQRVANRLAAVFVDDSSKARQQRAEYTSSFISSELAASQTRLGDLQARLRRAKESHIGQLPEQTQANLQTLSGLRQQIDANATALRGEQDRLSMIERQLESVIAGRVGRGRGAPDGAADGPLSADAAHRRAAARAGAAPLVVHRQTPRSHPPAGRARDRARRKRRASGSGRSSDRMAQLKTDPAYRQLVGDREAARLRIRELERAEADMRRQIGVYQARVESAPMVEQELASVQRDYDLEKQQYVELSAKLASREHRRERRAHPHRRAVLGAVSGRAIRPNRPSPSRCA